MDVLRELNRVQFGLELDAKMPSLQPHMAERISVAAQKLAVIIRHIEHETDAFAKLADEIERRVRKVAEGVS